MTADEKRIVTMGAGMAAIAAMAFGPPPGFGGWPAEREGGWRVSKNLKHPAEPDKKAARKRQKKARAITRRNRS